MYIGIDIGTSGVKTIVIDSEQNIIVSAHSALEVTRPHSGWSEQDPDEWINATANTLDSIKSSHGKELSAVKGIGLSGQMHGATLIDKQDKVIRPCMLWNDTRSHKEANSMDSNPLFRQLSGNIVFPGFTAPKSMWVKNNESENFAKIHKVLLPKDYVRLWLTGEYVTDMSDASGTAWLNVAERSWSEELLTASEMTIEQMPALIEGTEDSGQLRQTHCLRWGMKKAPIVAGGAGDNAASACGMGIIKDSSAFVSLGTSGVLFAANNKYSPDPESAVHAFCHAIPNTWHQMGVILSATDSLNWYAKIAGKNAAELTQALGENLNTPSKATFLPYLAGERTPHNDASIRGAFIGMSHESDQTELTQAVLEGVAFAFRDNLVALNKAGTEIKRLTAVGGGSRSEYWLKILATVLNMPVDIPTAGDFGGAFGAARLALIASTGEDPSIICTSPTIEKTIEPESSFTNAFSNSYSRYKSLYPVIKQVL